MTSYRFDNCKQNRKSKYSHLLLMINNINSYNNLLSSLPASDQQSTSASSSVEKIIDDYHQAQAVQSNTTTESPNNLLLSNRAQKISALNSEFFNGGSLALADVGALKERAYQLGLISQGDYQRLTNADVSATSSNQTDLLTTGSLASYISDFVIRLDKASPDKTDQDTDSEPEPSETILGLKKALGFAQSLFENVEQVKKQEDYNASITSAISFLKETISDEAFNAMPLDDQIGLSKVYQALEIVNKISPQRLNNDKINKYLQLAFD